MTFEQYIKKLQLRNENNKHINSNTIMCRNIVLHYMLQILNKNVYYTKMINRVWGSDLPFNLKTAHIENILRANERFLLIKHYKDILPKDDLEEYISIMFKNKSLGYFNNPHLKTDIYP